jgi:sugar (pentulose or hexulose) kinase
MSYLGIDIGTSFVKGAILDVQARRFSHIRRVPFPAPLAGTPASHVEIKPTAVVDAVRRLIADLGGLTDRCQGVLLCGQMGGVILVDRDGRPRTNYLSWRDQRVLDKTNDCKRRDEPATCLDRLRERLGEKYLAELGNELRPGSCTSLLFWLAEQQPHVLDGAVPLSLPAFVAGQLTGQIPTESTTIAIGAINVSTGQWHHEAFKSLGIDHLAWPNLDAAHAPLGEARLDTQRAVVYPAIGDHQCALLGVGLAENELSINVSTGSQVSRLTKSTAPGPFQLRHYFDGWLLQTITHLPAGRSLDGLVTLFTELSAAQGVSSDDVWSYILAQAAAAADSTLSAELTFFSGPLGDEGRLTGMRLENMTIGHVFRAAIESMARNYAHCARQLDPRQTWQRIVFSGGLANRIEMLRSLVLGQLSGAHRLCAELEDTLTGLLTLAMKIDGQAPSVLAASAALHSDENDKARV